MSIRDDVARGDAALQKKTAYTWLARAIMAYQMGRIADARSYADEALEHAALARDGGQTVAEIERALPPPSGHRRGRSRYSGRRP